ncbi:MAG: hypothetical protein H0W06_07350 [Chloroflexia bacterium]|nr:hypothetical protein [Chloroflexia bacterium]
MTAATIPRHQTGISLATLAPWCMCAGAAMQIILGFPLAPYQNPDAAAFELISALNAVSHGLLSVGVLGLARSGAAGGGRLATAGAGVTQLGLAVLVVAEGVSLIDMDVAVVLFSVSTLALAAGPIALGVAVLRTGRWTDWHRFTPLACGLYVPLILMPAFALPGYGPNFAIGLWGVCWLLTGLSQRAEATR